MSRARFIAAARLEFLAEVIYYSEAQAGLGTRFTTAVEEAAAGALAFPLSGSPFRANTRRVFVQEFPFALIYRPDPDGIVIFAIALQLVLDFGRSVLAGDAVKRLCRSLAPLNPSIHYRGPYSGSS